MARLKTVTRDEDLETVVVELVGEHALAVVTFLKGKERISEFEELELEINEVRNILYCLLEHNLVRFLRKKDRIKGWYICYWDLNLHMVPHLKRKLLQEKLEKMRARLAEEEGAQYYICQRACARMKFDDAVEQQFKCQECGALLQEQDNSRTKEFLLERIAELEESVQS